MRLFILTFLNGLTLAALYFMVASGFTLVFGLMRQVNLAHGSLYLLGGYVGYEVAQAAGSWFLGVGAGAIATLLLQSSSATTVMLVGFASAGLMTLEQTVALILGAD